MSEKVINGLRVIAVLRGAGFEPELFQRIWDVLKVFCVVDDVPENFEMRQRISAYGTQGDAIIHFRRTESDIVHAWVKLENGGCSGLCRFDSIPVCEALTHGFVECFVGFSPEIMQKLREQHPDVFK